MPLVLKSTLLTREQMGMERERSIRAAAEEKLLEMAHAALGPGKRLVIRDLTPDDLGCANNEWTYQRTGGTAFAWADLDIPETAGDVIADNRFVAILGLRISDGHLSAPLALLKFTVGGSEVARWEMSQAFMLYTQNTSGSIDHKNPPCIAEAPIFISQNTPFAIAEYVSDPNKDYKVTFIGLVVEPEGKVLKG
ncbi:hypothetical protein ES703_49052 [subsurface metagenome]